MGIYEGRRGWLNKIHPWVGDCLLLPTESESERDGNQLGARGTGGKRRKTR